MSGPTQSELRNMARDLVRGSMIEDAAAQFVALIIRQVHEERIAPLKEQNASLAARVVALEGHLSKCLDLLDVALEDHGKGKDWGEEDAFRMGEMFGREDIAAVQAARAKLEERG